MSLPRTDEPPLHVALNEPCPDARARPAVPGKSVRLQGKLHDFSVLVPLYGSSFTVRLLEAFTRAYVHATGSTTERRSANLRRLLVFIAGHALGAPDPGAPVARVFNALVDGQPETISTETMIDAVEAYTGPLRDLKDFSIVSTGNELTRQNMIESLSPILQELGREGLWPDIGPLRGLRDARVSSGDNIPSLGELDRSQDRDGAASTLITSQAKFMEVSRERLVRLRQLFEAALLKEEEAFDQQLDLTAVSNGITINEIRDAVRRLPTDFDRKRVRVELPPQVKRCFPLDDDKLRLSSLLQYIKAEHDGHFRLTDLSFGLRRVVATCGGTAKVMSFLEGGPRALMCAYTLVLIDSGINIQPCDDIAAEPFVGKAKHGKVKLRKISSVKNRAGYATVDAHLVEIEGQETKADHQADAQLDDELPLIVSTAKVSGAKAIEIWLKLSKPHRDRAQRAGNREADYLWILRHGHVPSEVRRYQHHSWKHWWSEFLDENADDPVIGGLPIQRRMIRTTVLQLRAEHHDSDANIVALLAGHASARATVRHYLNRGYIRRMLDEKIRDFQKLFEASVAGDIKERPAQLSLSFDEFSERRERATATGLGFLCSNPQAGLQPGTQGKTCTRLDACSSCPLLRFVPSKEAVEALVLFRRSLEAVQDEFISRNPERWVRVWLPALALCLAVCDLLAAGAKRSMLEHAHHFVEVGLTDGSLTMFRPW